MRIVFAGTPDFAGAALRALIAARHTIVLVLTQPDRPAGRHLELKQSPVKQIAFAHGLPVEQPMTLKDPACVARLKEANAEVMVVAAYGLIVPQALLEVTPLGCINIHASLLPRWRGAAPIERALLAGDRETGISIMQMDAGLDTGGILLQRRVPIAEDDTGETLHAKLQALGAACIVEALPALASGSLKSVPQGAAGATYAHKITTDEVRIDWTRPAPEVERAVRAYNPTPGAFTSLSGSLLKIWRARSEPSAEGGAAPGEVMEVGATELIVACGSGVLRVLELQRAGARRQSTAEFLRGTRLRPGARLGA